MFHKKDVTYWWANIKKGTKQITEWIKDSSYRDKLKLPSQLNNVEYVSVLFLTFYDDKCCDLTV